MTTAIRVSAFKSSATRQQLTNRLTDLGFIEVNPIFLVPRRPQKASDPNGDEVVSLIRYNVETVLQPTGKPFYIRSYGLRFNLVPWQWVKDWRRPICLFSLGPGLYAANEVQDLLLLQALGRQDQLDPLSIKLTERIATLLTHVTLSIETEMNLPCLRLAGVLA